jgi:hypothetical protein
MPVPLHAEHGIYPFHSLARYLLLYNQANHLTNTKGEHHEP